ncbi:MAG: HNH endonuclease [Verrucomicrobiota bacterium]
MQRNRNSAKRKKPHLATIHDIFSHLNHLLIERGASFYQKIPFDALFFRDKMRAFMAAIDRQVLVLNRLWQPVNICGARRAISLLFLGHAQVVHTEENSGFSTHDAESWLMESLDYKGSDVLHTVSYQFRVPAIVVLTEYDKLPRQEVKFSRQTIFERDKFTCQYCGNRFESKDLNLDHVIPREKGGETSWENVVCSCIRCNTRKANKLLAQANMRLLNEPRKPRWRPFHADIGESQGHSSWSHFIGVPSGEVSMSS